MGLLDMGAVKRLLGCAAFPAVVNEAVPPGGFLVAGDERDLPDLDPLRGREEGHAQRVPLDGGHDRPAVEEHAGEARLLRRHAHRQPAGAGADYQQISAIHSDLRRISVRPIHHHHVSMI
jgi:hypothetical protein